ncbi:MAG: cation transporter [Syntrophaceticus sp.]|jgi:copper chaperone|nr:cation transporter [Syntrophaceticus sp.]MDD3314731.1 cation transporter [Syntrophaceticus sp.]MDD4360448.1 cation transporter [Syntrophaceticus sp.]MDD4782792.1 cation transporter [Syntrophaceticus sp.]
MEKLMLKVEGMQCGHCKNAVEKAVNQLNGVLEASADVEQGALTVSFDPEKVGELQIKNAVETAGYKVK